MPFGYIHIVLRKIADIALHEFFKEIHVIGEENLPTDGPLIVCCTHHNMMIDPGILANTMRDKRPLHYWAKASLFKNPTARKVLLASGVIPVDRGSKDNQKLFAGTFEALAVNEPVALFPEGTSYTLPRIVQVKDGASWSALEYVKWVAEGAGGKHVNSSKDLVIVPAGITYTDKSKYRSCAVIEYGTPIRISDFEAQFLSQKEGDSRAAVKALTHAIEQGMVKLTINAPTWEALLSARMARDLLWGSWRNVPLADFRNVGQTLVDLFSTPLNDLEFASLMKALTTYHSLLKSTRLSNDALQTLPLPRIKKSSSSAGPPPIPSRLSTILPLLRETFAVLIRLPFFVVPLLIHIPVFYTTQWVGQRSEREEESVAQNKVVIGLFFVFFIYSFWFCAIWALFWLTPIGAIVAGITVYAMAVYYNSLIDDSYVRAKRLYSAYRVLVGVWGPKKWDLSLSALTQYTITPPPPPNQYLKVPDTVTATFNRSLSSPTVPTLSTVSKAETSAPAVEDNEGSKKDGKDRKRRRPPTRRLIRHVLRARTEAARQLGAFLKRIDRDGVRVSASAHLVDVFGGGYDGLFTQAQFDTEGFPTGWRSGKEVMSYLKSKGARFDRLYLHLDEDQPEYEWAALQGGGELSPLYTPGFPMSPESPASGSGYGSGSVSGNVSGSESKGEELDWVVPKNR